MKLDLRDLRYLTYLPKYLVQYMYPVANCSAGLRA